MLVSLERRGVECDTSMRRWLPFAGTRAVEGRIRMLAFRMLLSVISVTKFELQSVGIGSSRRVAGS